MRRELRVGSAKRRASFAAADARTVARASRSLEKKSRSATPIEFGFDSERLSSITSIKNDGRLEPIRNPRIRASTRSRVPACRLSHPLWLEKTRDTENATRIGSSHNAQRTRSNRYGSLRRGRIPLDRSDSPGRAPRPSPPRAANGRAASRRLARPNARVRWRVFSLRVNNDKQIAHLAVSHARVPRRRPDAPLNRRPMSAFSAVAPVRRVTQST